MHAIARALRSLAQAERAGAFVTHRARAAPDDRSGTSRRPANVKVGSDGAVRQAARRRIVERFGQNVTPLYLFGAGHVGRALVLALAPLPFGVTWTDPRPSAFPPHIPGNVTLVGDSEPVEVLARAPDGALIAIMTHSHALDLDLAAAALKSRRFPYVGLIGSATKRARFASTMSKLGIAKTDIDRPDLSDRAHRHSRQGAGRNRRLDRGAASDRARARRRAAGRQGPADEQQASCLIRSSRQPAPGRFCRRSASPSSTAASLPTTISISIFIRRRSTRCWARTVPANRRS